MVLMSIVSSCLSSNKLHSVHPSSLSARGGSRGGGAEHSTKFSKRRGLTVPQISESQRVVAGKNRSDFFQGECCSFYIKNKLKSEILNDKKGL